MDTNKKIRETISSFMDDELSDADAELALAGLRERDGIDAWRLYHEIGDTLRAETDAPALSPGFAARLAERLAAEPVPLRRDPCKPELPTDALAAIAPAVVGNGAANGTVAVVEPKVEIEAPSKASPAAKQL
ncbi:sigma-E factor negative regulatory protein [Telluria aromaticivorans]|uniref:Sigma-E factor negative regulatory protein n=1 Tax=Telluria aromaticivorans TaxID=2725995 RepID=A0A7Y2JVY6_9BURK|nr:sigma-E factor negative regulatory protein [Telluria aromaticivorans]NNG22027.1 sigma-E factor negative regulatory protein [Telluria aromaticivorans]